MVQYPPCWRASYVLRLQPVELDFSLLMPQCVAYSPARQILCHVSVSCKGPISRYLYLKTCFVFRSSPGMSPPCHSSSNETPRLMKVDPTQAKGPNPGPLGAAFPHSYEFHTKRKMFGKGPEVRLQH